MATTGDGDIMQVRRLFKLGKFSISPAPLFNQLQSPSPLQSGQANQTSVQGNLFMQLTKSLWIIICSLTFLVSSELLAQDKRYMNIHQVTHISGGWVAYSNGELYKCRFQKPGTKGSPDCILASGLPSNMQTVSTLWGENNEAWVAYTDGQVYGCRYRSKPQHEAAICMPASGLP